MGRIATFDLLRFAGPTVRNLGSVPLHRRALAGVDGLVLGRFLGTAAGASTSGGADLHRWAVFAVWEDAEAAEDFWTHDPLARRWGSAQERWTATLAPRRSHGRWAGIEPFGDADRTDAGPGPVAVLTRATVRPLRLRPFHAARRPVDAVLHRADGLLSNVGMGEWPIGQQATFSIWRDDAAVRAFARRDPIHADVVRRTRTERWYAEELFAAFSIVSHAGTWDGTDPLGIVIRPAAGRDLDDLGPLEQRAATRFDGLGLSGIAGSLGRGRLEAGVREERLWVAESAGTLVGFVLVSVVDGAAFVDEIDVDPAHGRRGIGTRLMAQVSQWARGSGFASVTVTTFRDIAWNDRWYHRLGFCTVDLADCGPDLHAIVARERVQGLDMDRRAIMRLALRGPTTTGSA
ncbi:MAG: hypothetical protein NVS3B12_00460 [Acidimicrobiales bacterium]